MPLKQKATRIHLQYRMFLLETAQKSMKMQNPCNYTPQKYLNTSDTSNRDQRKYSLFLNHPELFQCRGIQRVTLYIMSLNAFTVIRKQVS